jgi:hypothetical protein
MKNSNDTIGDRSRYFPVSNEVPQTLRHQQHAPHSCLYFIFFNYSTILSVQRVNVWLMSSKRNISVSLHRKIAKILAAFY